MILLIPAISRAIKCSLVCGWGQVSFAATINKAPSIILAPPIIIAIKVSCPGASTNETTLSNSTGSSFSPAGCFPDA